MVDVIIPGTAEVSSQPMASSDEGPRMLIEFKKVVISSTSTGGSGGVEGEVVVDRFFFNYDHFNNTQGVGDALDPGLEAAGIELQPDITPTETITGTFAGTAPPEADILI